jgi:lipoprotein-anchoring transpeptidase ErfK/SrfK
MRSQYYQSSPRQVHRGDQPRVKRTSRYRTIGYLLLLLVLLAGGFGAVRLNDHQVPAKTVAATAINSIKTTPISSKSAVTAAATVNHCSENTLDQNVIVSITARHLWVCNTNQQVYDSPVVTGQEKLAADLTPTGTYHIYAKETDQTLTGSDSTGSWSDPVSYWMPFLYNQYGAYGFHDATWRAPSAFGNISPDSSDASHGCVELPLATAKYIYNWSQVGTTVTIES